MARRIRMWAELPIIIAPRGELSAGALGVKGFKKRLYIRAAKLAGIYRGLTWHASSATEQSEIERTLGGLARSPGVVSALNLAAAFGRAQRQCRKSERDTQHRHISRVLPLTDLPKKILDFALRVMAQVKVPLVFSIHGPMEDASYWRRCERLISALPAHIDVRYCGPVQPEDVHKALASNDLFFLPTRGENFGHVILEALQAGLPVLLSDQTPWYGVPKAGVGWTLPLGAILPFVNAIEECSTWTDSKRTAVQRQAIDYGEQQAVDAMTLDRNRMLFRNALATR